MRVKFICQALLVCVAFDLMLWSQAYSQAKTEPMGQRDKLAVANYLSVLREKAGFMQRAPRYQKKKVFQAMSNSELKHAARMMSDATMSEAGRRAVQDSIAASARRSDEMYTKGAVSRPRLAYVQMELLNRIRTEISPTVYALLRVAYFLNVRVTEVENIRSGYEAGSIVISAIVTRVYKGNERFKPGDRVEFYFYNYWQKESRRFQAGREYFVPLEPRNEGSTEYPERIALVPYLDDSNGYYPIVGEEVLDAHDFFKLGNRVRIDVFEEKLKALMQEMRSW